MGVLIPFGHFVPIQDYVNVYGSVKDNVMVFGLIYLVLCFCFAMSTMVLVYNG